MESRQVVLLEFKIHQLTLTKKIIDGKEDMLNAVRGAITLKQLNAIVTEREKKKQRH